MWSAHDVLATYSPRAAKTAWGFLKCCIPLVLSSLLQKKRLKKVTPHRPPTPAFAEGRPALPKATSPLFEGLKLNGLVGKT